MRNLKKIIFVAIIVAIWGMLLIYFYREDMKTEREKETQVLIINSNYFWKYEKGNWNSLSIKNDTELYDWKQFDVYIDNSFYKTYKYIFSNGKGYFFDKNEKS